MRKIFNNRKVPLGAGLKVAPAYTTPKAAGVFRKKGFPNAGFKRKPALLSKRKRVTA